MNWKNSTDFVSGMHEQASTIIQMIDLKRKGWENSLLLETSKDSKESSRKTARPIDNLISSEKFIQDLFVAKKFIREDDEPVKFS